MIGRSFAHYRIIAALGAGGMGEVYRAMDTRLDREVALKILPTEFAADSERIERFRREARALAALDHPGIVGVFSVEETSGVHFITMQLVPGRTLDALIPESGMPLDQLLAIGTALTDALAAAHEKGIVHRDLKPANVMVADDGRVKVLDFGLAKVTPPAAGPGSSAVTAPLATSEGVVLGTVPYMSPEQLTGLPVDQRSDLFSLGVMLYEMACGRRPFVGQSSIEIASSILRDTPQPLSERRAAVGGRIAELIERALSKDASDRPSCARHVHDALVAARRERETDAAGVTGARTQSMDNGSQTPRDPRTPSIAVLPFADMSPTRDHDWFCEGIAEEILNALSKLPGLRVTTRTSAFRFKDPARDIRKIGELLGVSTLLEGGVRTAGSQLRVTAQLVNTADGCQLWSARFDREMKDVFAIQDEIAQQVVEALELRLVASPRAMGGSPRSGDLESYHLFLKGRHFRYTKLDLRSALRCFEAAVHRDPGYAMARIALAETLVILVVYGMISPSTGLARAREQLARARELTGESAHALGVEALIVLTYDWDSRAALAAFERALALDPDFIPARAWYTWALAGVGRTDEAIEHAMRLVQLDPQSPFAISMAGFAHLLVGRTEAALQLERRAIEIAPDSLQAMYMLGLVLSAIGQWDEAEVCFGRAIERSARGSFFVTLLVWCQAAAGRTSQARETFAELERRAVSEYVCPLFMAVAVSEMGDAGRARGLLDDAFAERSSMLVLPTLPCMRQLRGAPMLQDLARRLLGETAMFSAIVSVSRSGS